MKTLQDYRRERSKKNKKVLFSILRWSGILFLVGLFIDAVRTPMIEYGWGFYNIKLIMVIFFILIIGIITNFIKIRKLSSEKTVSTKLEGKDGN